MVDYIILWQLGHSAIGIPYVEYAAATEDGKPTTLESIGERGGFSLVQDVIDHFDEKSKKYIWKKEPLSLEDVAQKVRDRITEGLSLGDTCTYKSTEEFFQKPEILDPLPHYIVKIHRELSKLLGE